MKLCTDSPDQPQKKNYFMFKLKKIKSEKESILCPVSRRNKIKTPATMWSV